MFFTTIFGGIVEITFFAHIIDVDVSDFGFSWNRTSIEWLRSLPLCCKIWTALWLSNNLSCPISSISFLQIFWDPPTFIPLQNPAWKYIYYNVFHEVKTIILGTYLMIRRKQRFVSSIGNSYVSFQLSGQIGLIWAIMKLPRKSSKLTAIVPAKDNFSHEFSASYPN